MSKKVFRKYCSSSSKKHMRPLLVSLLIFALDLLIVIMFLSVLSSLTSFSWRTVFQSAPARILILLGLICCFFLLLLVLCIFNLSKEPLYTLVLDASTLHYEDDIGSYDLKLPCSFEKDANAILLSDDTLKLTIRYDDKRDQDLLEFLKDAIN